MKLTSFKLSKYQKLLLFLLFISLILSFIFYHKLINNTIINEVKDIDNMLSNHLNFISLHLNIIGILLIISLILLSKFLFPFIIIYELLSIIYNIFIFFHVFKFKGLIFSLIYNLITKALYLLFLLLLYKHIRKLVKDIKNKTISNNINYLRKIAIYIILIIINDILIYFLANKILLKLTFIIK